MAIGKQHDGGDDLEEEGVGGGGLFAEINITPLTDVFLVMVVIFMVSALAVQAEDNQRRREEQQKKAEEKEEAKRGIAVNLPAGHATEFDTSRQPLVLDIPTTGGIYVGGVVVTDERLEQVLRAAYAKDKQTQVVLRADKAVPHGRIVELMDRAKMVGLSKIVFPTK
jgi:biopolymer transport protein ExbD